MDKMIAATYKAIAEAGLNVKGSLYRDDGSFLITAVELTNQFGSEEPVQTMSIDIMLDKVDSIRKP